MSLRHILFDLDETLYPSSSGLLDAISRKMTEYVSDLLGLDPGEAARMRKNWGKKYGTTLGGLVNDYGLSDPEGYLFYTHAVSIGDYLNKDLELIEVLSSISQPKSILTNSPMEHSERVLGYLEIIDQFEYIFDIRFNAFIGKPVLSTYEKASTLRHFLRYRSMFCLWMTVWIIYFHSGNWGAYSFSR